MVWYKFILGEKAMGRLKVRYLVIGHTLMPGARHPPLYWLTELLPQSQEGATF